MTAKLFTTTTDENTAYDNTTNNFRRIDSVHDSDSGGYLKDYTFS